MHHEYLDKYSRLDSVVHRMDAKRKFLVSLILVIMISIIQNIYIISLILILVGIGFLLSKVPIRFVMKRLILCFPFLVFLFFLPIERAVLLFTKAITSISIILLLMSTTKFSKVLETMRYVMVPKLFIMMFSFFYRYIFLFGDIIHRMMHARDSRCFTTRQKLDMRTVSNMVGCIIVRSYDQSERVYAAMLARGYDDKDQ